MCISRQPWLVYGERREEVVSRSFKEGLCMTYPVCSQWLSSFGWRINQQRSECQGGYPPLGSGASTSCNTQVLHG